MKENDFERAINLKVRLDELTWAKRNISSGSVRLTYVYFSRSLFREVTADDGGLSRIKDILDRHDQQIRKEVEDEIQKVLNEIEAL
jgi:hypothetical protein